MPKFDRSKVTRGGEAIDRATASRGENREFKPFLPSIYWKDADESRYIMILNPMDDVSQVLMHPFVNIGDGIPHQVIARTDGSVGDKVDPIERDWKYTPRLTDLAIAVELEPKVKVVNGRSKPVGFEVKTLTFERRIRDDKGELTEDREEATVPVVGLIAQSPYNFFNLLRSYDATEAPIHQTAIRVTRLGTSPVTYTVQGYDGIPVDLTNLFDFIENVSYLPEPEELVTALGECESDEERSMTIGNFLLDLKLDELGDDENYVTLYEQITEPSRFQKEEKKSRGSSRPTRPSVRRSEPEESEEPVARRSNGKSSKETPAAERLARLRQRSKEAQTA